MSAISMQLSDSSRPKPTQQLKTLHKLQTRHLKKTFKVEFNDGNDQKCNFVLSHDMRRTAER